MPLFLSHVLLSFHNMRVYVCNVTNCCVQYDIVTLTCVTSESSVAALPQPLDRMLSTANKITQMLRQRKISSGVEPWRTGQSRCRAPEDQFFATRSAPIETMRAIIQRVTSASVTVDGKVVSKIGRGALVLLGITKVSGCMRCDGGERARVMVLLNQNTWSERS